MIRRMAATLMSALVLGVVVASPALAGQRDTTPPTVPPMNETPLGDDRLEEGDAPSVVDGLGTARAHVTGLQFLAPDLDLRVIDTHTTSTLDHERAGLDENSAHGYFAAVSLMLGDDTTSRTLESLDMPNTLPWPPYEAHSRGGEHTEQFQQFPVLLPETDTPVGTINWEKTADGPVGTLNYLCRKVQPDCEFAGVKPLEGENHLGFGRGDIVEGLLEPGRVQSRMNDDGGRASANSSLSELVMLSGLSVLENAGLGDLAATATSDASAASTRALKMQSLDVLRLEALLDLLGLDPNQIPHPVLAAMADALGINPVTLVRDAKTVDSVVALYDTIAALVGDVSDQIIGGATCELLAPSRLAAWARQAATVGATPPDCFGLGGLQAFLDSLQSLQQDLIDALENAMNDAALLRMENLWASAGATAEVGPDGRPAFGHGIKGGISSILVGSAPVTGLDLRDYADDWNGQEELVNQQLNNVLANLGPEFRDIVRLRLVPEWIEEHGVEEHDGLEYARSHTRLVLARVMVDTPDIDPAAVLARLQADAQDRIADTADALFGTLGVSEPEVELPPVELTASTRSSGGGADGGVLGQVVPGQSLTITVGEFDVDAEHTRPGVDIPCDDKCDSSTYLTRVFDPERGRFVPASGGDPDGSLPRTGGLGTWPIGAAAILTGSAWVLSRLQRRSTLIEQT